MGRNKKNKEAETKSVSVTLDMSTYKALSLLAFLRGSTVSGIISDFVASKKNSINKEIEDKLSDFRGPKETGGTENGEETE